MGKQATRWSGGRLTAVQGVTLIELLVLLALLGAAAAYAIPRTLRTSPLTKVDRAARQLVRNLEQTRTRAMAEKRRVRVTFDAANGFYAAFIDTTPERNGTILETAEEARASKVVSDATRGGIPGIELRHGVQFGRGNVMGLGPLGEVDTDAITLDGDAVEFTARGMATPVGVNGTVYITHESDQDAVAAVTISGAGAFQSWRYREGKWVR